MTTTGVPWLQGNQTWSRSHAAATSFDDTPEGRSEVGQLVERLAVEHVTSEDDRHGEPVDILIDPDVEQSLDALPPIRIRDHGYTWREPR